MSFPAIPSLSSQRADWNELSLDYQLAGLSLWYGDGYLPTILYCLGA
jgi:hypothetical protein